MIKRSTFQLLRIHFSFFLMPVYWFAISQIEHKNWPRAILIFIILHLLVYPASNGYNSYMDRDQGSIGGLKNPSLPTRQLFWISLGMDIAAVCLGLFISPYFTAGLTAYIIASRAYSYRGIRLKSHPVTGYLTVVLFQGALTFFLVYHGAQYGLTLHIPPEGMLASSLLVGGFYPLTQIYQHEADLKDGVKTISYLLGYRGTFVYAALVYSLAFGVLAYYLLSSLEINEFFVLATAMIPVIVYFLIWAAQVWKDKSKADYEHTMRMNIIAATCTNLGFIAVQVMQ